MKMKKVLSMLLSAAVVTAAAIPMMASAEGDVVNINGTEGNVVVTGENTGDEVCKAEFDGEAMKLTFGPQGGSDSSVYSTFEANEIEVDLTKTPVLYWDTEGGQFNILMRFLDSNGMYDPANNHNLINLAALANGGTGIDSGKDSLDLAKAMKDKNIGEGQDKILIRILKYRVVGNPGDTVTFNKLYFAAADSGDVSVPPVEDKTTTKGDATTTTTAAGGNGTTTTAKSTDSPKTGDVSSVAVMAVVAVAAAGGVLAFSKKKSK